MKTLRIATRKSPLALWQAEHVKARLQALHPYLTIHLVPMNTRGDKILDTPLAKIGGKGLFLKELELAILEDRADIAVHSMKDVPMSFDAGLALHCICQRENPRDAFVSNHASSLDALKHGAVVGTSSLRRQSQLLQLRPDLIIKDLRGNVNTRLSKLDEGEFDAIILACAGLQRLDMHARITQVLEPELILPAGGQGAIGIEGRDGDESIMQLLAPLHDAHTAATVGAERAMNHYLQGGCQVPIGAFAQLNAQGELHLRGLVASLDGKQVLRAEARGLPENAEQIGIEVAKTLFDAGAQALLERCYQ